MSLSKPIRKILAIKLRALGDTLIFTSSIREIKKAFPQAELHVVATKPWDELLENNPAITKLWRYDRREDRALRAKTIASLALKLRKENYDAVINFHASPSSAMMAFATGAPIRSNHFHGHRDANKFSTVTIPGKGVLKPIIERDWDAIRALGANIPPLSTEDLRLPVVYVTDEERNRAHALLNSKGLKEPHLFLGFGASRPTKCWPIERFAAVARKWVEHTHGSVVAITASNERPLVESFFKEVKGGDGTAFQALEGLPLREIAAVLQQASVFVGNDSGPKHLAVSVGTPTVTLFGPEDPYEWHPYPLKRHPIFFIKDLPCRKDADPGMPPWCGIQVCDVEKLKCMTGIGVDEVFKKVIEVARS